MNLKCNEPTKTANISKQAYLIAMGDAGLNILYNIAIKADDLEGTLASNKRFVVCFSRVFCFLNQY